MLVMMFQLVFVTGWILYELIRLVSWLTGGK